MDYEKLGRLCFKHIKDYSLRYANPDGTIGKDNAIIILGRFLHMGCPQMRCDIIKVLEQGGFYQQVSRGKGTILYKIRA
jgi:hypothetical protein